MNLKSKIDLSAPHGDRMFLVLPARTGTRPRQYPYGTVLSRPYGYGVRKQIGCSSRSLFLNRKMSDRSFGESSVGFQGSETRQRVDLADIRSKDKKLNIEHRLTINDLRSFKQNKV